MMNSSEVIAPMLVSFSTVGFIIFIGIATFVPMAYDILTRDKSVGIARYYPIRLIARFSKTSSIRYLMVISFLFVLTGLLGLIYLLFENVIILTIALVLAILIEFFLLIFILYISLDAISIKKRELIQIVDYFNSDS